MRAPYLLAALILVACEAQPGDVDADGLVDCRDLDGTFEAERVRFTAGDRVEDFDGRPDVQTDLSYLHGTFSSSLREDDEVVTSTGDFFVDDEGRLSVSSPIVPGMAVRGSSFACAYDHDARELRLAGVTGYAFDASGEPVEADFEATFVGF